MLADAVRSEDREIGVYEFDSYVRQFGRGCAGAGRFVPTMDLIGLPQLGKQAFPGVRNDDGSVPGSS